jgi:hypothetical protein
MSAKLEDSYEGKDSDNILERRELLGSGGYSSFL